MRQVVISRYGTPEVLKIQERPDLQAGPGEMLIKVKAAGINFADLLARQGLYPDAPKPPCVVGYEVSGTVGEVGEGVDPDWIGKAILAVTNFGGYSEQVIVKPFMVFPKPEKLSFEEAAAIPVNYLTAYQLLVVMGGIKRGENVLIHNLGGGVGLAALDIAKHYGAVVYGTASSVKHEFLKSRGAAVVIEYRQKDWFKELNRITGGRGIHLILDPLGGKNWKLSYRALAPTGRLGVFGISNVTESGLSGKFRFLKILWQMPWFNPIGLMQSNRGVFGANLGHLWREGERIRSWMEEILQGVETGWVRPHVDRVFRFNQAPAAHAYIEARRNIGKVVLIP